MNSLKEIRAAAGMSQQEFAGLLGVQRENLAYAELKQRVLSMETIGNLWHIEKYFMENSQVCEEPYFEEYYIIEKIRLEGIKQSLVPKRTSLEGKLCVMVERLEKGLKVYHLCMHLQQNKFLDEAKVENMLSSARSKIFANGELCQEEVKAQLLLLSAEESSIIQRLAKLSEIQTPMK